jgi:histidine triad (HIT) family protein
MPEVSDCLFCKIASKEIPADLIYEDDKVVAFLDIKPVNKGHSLIIPKKHSHDLLDADDATLGTMIARVKKIAGAIMAATGAAGFNLGINTKSAAGQVVFHTHFHIIPRFSNDGLKMWPHSESEPKTRKQMAEEIKKFITYEN